MSILTLDIGGTAVKYGLSDLEGRLSHRGECPTQAELGGMHIADLVLGIVREHPEVQAVGISTAGLVETGTGTILYATDNLPGYTGLPLGELVRKACGKPVCVENDVYAAALGELAYGCGKDLHSFLFLAYGTGIGGAYVQDGILQRGVRGLAGYWGHIVTHPDGRSCTCGQRGCYEAYASTAALVREVEMRTGRETTGRRLFHEAERDPCIQGCVDAWIGEVLLGLVTLINTMDPEAVILGGGIMGEEGLADEIRRRLPDYLPPVSRDIAVRSSGLGNTAGMLGAVYLCRRLLEIEGG